MTLLTWANILYPIIACVAMFLMAHKCKSAFLVFLVVEVLMIYIGIKSDQTGIITMALIYFVLNIYSYVQWSKISDV